MRPDPTVRHEAYPQSFLQDPRGGRAVLSLPEGASVGHLPSPQLPGRAFARDPMCGWVLSTFPWRGQPGGASVFPIPPQPQAQLQHFRSSAVTAGTCHHTCARSGLASAVGFSDVSQCRHTDCNRHSSGEEDPVRRRAVCERGQEVVRNLCYLQFSITTNLRLL